MWNDPLISVLMPVRDGKPYVGDAIGSILGQTVGDFELLVIDDGSTDGTPDLLDDIAARDDRLIVHRRDAGNYVDRLNEGLSIARGRYVARHDADDLSEPTRFERQVAVLGSRPEVACVGSRMIDIDPLGVELGETDHASDHDDIDRQLMQGIGWAMAHPAATFRREAVDVVGGYRPEYVTCEDLDLFLRFAEIGRLANVAEPLVRYRRHPKSVNRTRQTEQRQNVWKAVRDARARRGHAEPDAGGWASLEVAETTQPEAAELVRRWGWNALKRGRVREARRHARDLIATRPLSPATWRLAACALRGR